MHLSSKNSFHDEFLQDDFSVDAFLQNYSGTYTLEGLRDALSLHLKSLESRMIDIVNSESDTILSLSSSLNGLDGKIDNLRSSLEQLKEEVMSVLHIIEYNLKTVKSLLDSKKNIHIEKRNYVNLIQAMLCCERVKKILESESYSKPLQSDILLRAVDQYLLQETHLAQCDQSLLTDIENKDIVNVKRLVYKNYTDSFLDAFTKKNSEEILRILQIGVFLHNQKDTEQLIRQKIVSPKLNNLINEKTFTQKGLVNLYESISKFVSDELELILAFTTDSNNGIEGYNFFINSIWVDIEEKLRINLSSIFAPGNPSVFQNRFMETMKFFTTLNDKWASNNETIFQHNSYQIHMKRWNLPVYFQICFNDIVLPYERILVEENLTKMYTEKNTDNNFKLLATSSVLRSINRCLQPDIYIPQIVHKFWKLVLQIISRYNTWVTSQLTLYANFKIDDESSTFEEKMKFLTYLQYDIKLLSVKIKDINKTIFPQPILNIITQNLESCSEMLLKKLSEVETIISTILSAQSIFALKQVSNIPRLYRKTNRSVPTEPAPYVYKVLETPQSFVKNYQNLFPKPTFELILTNIYEKITNEYVNVVDEILTQVRKTEDSLRRLKKVRQSQTPESGIIGDDQKIRIQLQLDVKYYCEEVKKTSSNVNLSPLINLVKDTN